MIINHSPTELGIEYKKSLYIEIFTTKSTNSPSPIPNKVWGGVEDTKNTIPNRVGDRIEIIFVFLCVFLRVLCGYNYKFWTILIKCLYL